MRLWTKWSSSWNGILACARSGVRGLALFLIAIYRSTLSPIYGGICRFEPSCSCYAQRAFETHSPTRAFYLTARRLLKCHPFGPFGFDPVPLSSQGTALEKR